MPADKLLHLLVGALIVALLWPVSGTASAVCCFVAAVGKEIYDDQHRDVHTPDMLDIVATLAGGVISALWLKSLDWWM
jgi:hypothetical protein